MSDGENHTGGQIVKLARTDHLHLIFIESALRTICYSSCNVCLSVVCVFSARPLPSRYAPLASRGFNITAVLTNRLESDR